MVQATFDIDDAQHTLLIFRRHFWFEDTLVKDRNSGCSTVAVSMILATVTSYFTVTIL